MLRGFADVVVSEKQHSEVRHGLLSYDCISFHKRSPKQTILLLQ